MRPWADSHRELWVVTQCWICVVGKCDAIHACSESGDGTNVYSNCIARTSWCKPMGIVVWACHQYNHPLLLKYWQSTQILNYWQSTQIPTSLLHAPTATLNLIEFYKDLSMIYVVHVDSILCRNAVLIAVQLKLLYLAGCRLIVFWETHYHRRGGGRARSFSVRITLYKSLWIRSTIVLRPQPKLKFVILGEMIQGDFLKNLYNSWTLCR